MKAHLGRPISCKMQLRPQRWLIPEDGKTAIMCIQTAGYVHQSFAPQMGEGLEHAREYILHVDCDEDIEMMIEHMAEEDGYEALDMSEGQYASLLASAEEIEGAQQLIRAFELAKAPATIAQRLLPGNQDLERFVAASKNAHSAETHQALRTAIWDRALLFKDIFPEYINFLQRHAYDQDVSQHLG